MLIGVLYTDIDVPSFQIHLVLRNPSKLLDQILLTNCSIQETLRKYNVVPVVTRQASVDEEICGQKVPKNTYIACYISAVHMREWEDPESWKPERFLPGGEYESFPEDIRQYKVRTKLDFHQHNEREYVIAQQPNFLLLYLPFMYEELRI